MPSRVLSVRHDAHAGDPDGVAAELLREGIETIRRELEVSAEFAADVDEAAAKAAAEPRLPELDRTDIPFVTIDPPSAMDLDQALHIERDGDGYVVHYAIADVAAFVAAGDPIDVEARRRGETLYGADSKVPLHPKVLSEGAASLLPNEVRPALLWTIPVAADGTSETGKVERALVRSRAKLDYASVQKSIDDGTADESLQLLKIVGELRLAQEAERGGVSLPLPEQEIQVVGETWSLDFRALLPAENWNAQISLLTGFTAARMMLEGKVGLLRTLPPAQQRDVDRLRRTAKALKIDWPGDTSYPDFVRSLDPARPTHAAMLIACTRLLRGSGYAGFDGTVPEQPLHAALAAPYAHVTAPLRRLGDRFAAEICVALSAGQPVPEWATAALKDLPALLQESGRKAGRYERAILDLVEAGVLAEHVGETFAAVVVEVDERDPRRGEITVERPAIEAEVTGSHLPLGEEVSVRLERADIHTRTVEFTLAE